MSEASGSHLTDLAASYALGSLDAQETEQLLEHIARCESCRASVADAQASVAAMIEGGEQFDPPAGLRRRIRDSAGRRSAAPALQWPAIAAALILWIAPAAWFYAQVHRQSETIDGQAAAIGSLVHSHFLHAPFTALVSNAPAAKVIFPAKGGWFYVIAAAAPDDLLIGTQQGGRLRILGKPANVGGNSALYDAQAQGIDNVVIIRDNRIVARAAILRRKGE